MADQEKRVGTVLVVGAGIAGIKAALELAETGYKVLLAESSPHIGGILAKLDHQFPNNHCGMCRMLPMVGREYASQHCMRKSLFHDNIDILPFTEVKSVRGDAGAYQVELIRHARHVNTEICNGFGECVEACPVEVPDEFNHGLTNRKAIYQPVPHNLPQMLVVDTESCTRCGECLKVCPTDAIDLDARDETTEVEVDSIIFASGITLYDPKANDDAKPYTVSDDVVTSLAFERILSGSGTYDGVIRRPSDGKPAKRIAWIQCVGSRNRRHGRDYCSSICCMFALKEAVLAHEEGGPDMETTIFYMDMRTFGKDYYRYRQKAENEHGVNLVRCRVQEVLKQPDGTLLIRYYDPKSGEFKKGEFDMVVLSTGQSPFEDHKKVAELLDVPLADSGLVRIRDFSKVSTVKDGVYLCGSLMGLTDINEAITSGIAAAGESAKLLSSINAARICEEEVPEKDVERESPRVAAILCRCKDEKVPGGLDLESFSKEIEKLNAVDEVYVADALCRDENREALEEILKKTKANRVLFGACLPYVYKQKLKKIARQAGFNYSLVEIFNLLDPVRRSVNDDDDNQWMERIKNEILLNVDKLRLTRPLHVEKIPINPAALVVGGGVAGLRCALSLSDREVPVHIVEKSGKLGGHVGAELQYTVDNLDTAGLVDSLVEQVRDRENITVHLNSEVIEDNGVMGNFRSTVRNNHTEETIEVEHGAVILATGGHEGRTTEYCHNESDRVVTQSEFENRLSKGEIDAAGLNNVVMIQCVGSREKGGREYCSRICCAGALKNAFKIREQNPETNIYVLNRDIMTYGYFEQYYTKARGEGVVFVKYDLDSKPTVEVVDDKTMVRFTDHVLQMDMEVAADQVILATGIEPSPGNVDLARVFGIDVNRDGFFVEADSKWRPVEFNKMGIFLAGTAHAPQSVNESLMQSEASAQKAYEYLSRKEIISPRVVSVVHDALCSRCQRCVEVCPYDARSYDEEKDRIVVDPAACQACGMCEATCPNNAAEVPGWNEKQTMTVIDDELRDETIPATL